MKNRASLIVSAALLALAAALPLFKDIAPAIAGPYPLSLARSIFTYMALAIAWDILFRSGQVSFGLAGFFGLGIYGSALAVLRLGVSPWLSIPLAALFAGAVALLFGTVILRLRAIYFSITTLALAEIFRIILHNGGSFTGGAEGLFVPNVISTDNATLYWLALSGVVVAIAVSSWFERSKIRYALTAIRNNELQAKSSGVNIFGYLLVAFVASSFVAGFAGGILFQSYGSSGPDSAFDSNYTLLPLAMALLGGVHSTVGPVIGAVLLGLVAETLKLKIPYGHLVVYGLIIIVVILFMPNGLYGLWRKSRRRAAAAAGKEAARG
jgi:ABC-type branched-chain amino acid transport system, permease component